MTLLVPVALDALVVREPGESWARTAMETPVDDGRSRRQRLAPPPFTEREQPRPPGVYLHWAVPDAMTRAAPDTTPPAFPAIPDQWLVVRLSGPPSTGRTVRTWRLPPRPGPARAADPRPPDTGGVPVPGGELPATPPLTALGPGDPAWSAAFDNVVGTWGLYDDAADVPDGSLAYLVCGWFGEARLDPLFGAAESTFWSRLAGFDWDLDPEILDDLPVPKTCLFHGAAVGIGWPDERWPGGGVLGDEMDLRPAAEDVEVGLADTVAAALAALADEEPTTPGAGGSTAPGASTIAQRLVEATLTGLSADFARDDGPTRVDAALHAARFGHRPGRPVTEIVWRPSTGRPGFGPLGSGPRPGSDEPGGVDLPEPFDFPLPGEFSRVIRPGPRVWHPADPAVALSGAGRGFAHGGDGRFTASGHLVCRTTGHTVTAVGASKGDPGAGADVLDPADLAAALGPDVPDECADLVVELAALDPGSAPDLPPPIGPGPRGPVGPRPGKAPRDDRPTPPPGDPLPSPIAGARAALWTLRLPWVDLDLALESTRVAGLLPSPLALTPPSVPWAPFRLDWTVEYLPSPGSSHDWALADLDFEPVDRAVIPTTGRALTGSSVLSAHAAALAEQGLPEEPPGPKSAIVPSPPPTPVPLDLLSAGLSDLAARLRGDPLDPVVRPRGARRFQPAPGPRPAGFLPFRAGWLRVSRLRLVDGFGRYLDLMPGGAPLVTAASVRVPGRPELSLFPPRFTAPARLSLRLTDGYGGLSEATDGISPVAGYLLPSPLEGTIEVFDDEGVGLGRVVADTAGVTRWEPEPGTPAGIGATPADSVGNPVLLDLLSGLLAADAGVGVGTARHLSALESLRRVLDVTRWTVDEVGVAGGEHLALMLGHPVVVVRAQLDLVVEDPRMPVENSARMLPVRLGVLGHLQDGLLGYVVGDRYDRVHVVDPVISELASGAEPLPDYVDVGDGFTVQPGSPVSLTLLMVPGSQVHATTGLLPRKAITLQRSWTADAMARISPTTSRGPILRDPTATRLPVTGRVRGQWMWHRRETPVTWVTDEVVPATQEALLTPNLQLSDGWLQLDRAADFTGEAPLLTVSCVTTSTSGEIEKVGIEQANGTRVLVPVAQVAGLAAAGHVRLQSRRKKGPAVPVVAARRTDGRRVLEAPHDLGDALLDLPRCVEDAST